MGNAEDFVIGDTMLHVRERPREEVASCTLTERIACSSRKSRLKWLVIKSALTMGKGQEAYPNFVYTLSLASGPGL